MHSRKTITIVTSPSTPSKPLPGLGTVCKSPTTKHAPLYRIEERCRTIYVSSDVDPTQWDTHSLDTVFTLAEVPESDQDSSEQPIRRTRSHVDSQAACPLDHTARKKHESVPRCSVYRARLPGIKSAPLHPSTDIRVSNLQGSTSNPSSARTRILFYHKDQPYYGFTNFSPHPVIYEGKKYPTSEHLFQSFKVRSVSDVSFLKFMTLACYWHSSRHIGRISQNTFGHALKDPASLFQRLDASNLK